MLCLFDLGFCAVFDTDAHPSGCSIRAGADHGNGVPDAPVFVKLKNKKFSLTMLEVLNVLRLKVWKELDSDDALRFKASRVSIDNVPRGLFAELFDLLQRCEATEGQNGDCLWRRGKVTKILNGEHIRDTFAITTIKAASVLLNLYALEPDLESQRNRVEFGSSVLKMSNVFYGTVKFVDVPIHVDRLVSTRYGVTTYSLELGFGVGVISNCSAPYLRRASGHPEFQEDGPYPEALEWPVLPPYVSSEKYMDYHIGLRILTANKNLRNSTVDRDGGQLSFSENIVNAARQWIKQVPEKIDRLIWHHPRLKVAQCGDAVPDHIVVARAEAHARQLQQAEQRRAAADAVAALRKEKSELRKDIIQARKCSSRARVKELIDLWYQRYHGEPMLLHACLCCCLRACAAARLRCCMPALLPGSYFAACCLQVRHSLGAVEDPVQDGGDKW